MRKTEIVNKTSFIYLLLILMIITWSFSFVIVDITVEIISPLSLALYRFIMASLALIIFDMYSWLNKKRKNTEPQEPNNKYSTQDCLLLILSSFSGISIFFLIQYSAIQLIGPSLPAFFVCLLSPALITAFSILFFKEKLTLKIVIGFIIATIGAFLLFTGGDLTIFSLETPNFVGYLLALVTPALWAIYTMSIKQIGKSGNKSNSRILKHVAYLGTFELFIFVMINNEFNSFLESLFNPVIFLCAIYLGIGCYLIGFSIWTYSQNKLASSKSASFLYVEPFLTLLISFLLQRNETIVLLNIIGGVIVLIAVLIINFD